MRKLIILLLFVNIASAQYNLFVRQNFEHKVSNGTNTEIGGVASTISTAALLATKLGISVGAISNFTIVGSDIKCKITGSYAIPANAFSNNSNITYYNDIDGLVSSLGFLCFYKSKNLIYVHFKNTTNIGYQCFDGDGFIMALETVYTPLCNVLGNTTGYNTVFRGCYKTRFYCSTTLSTNNSGLPDGDISSTTSQNIITNYVTNYTSPNAVTNLSVGPIYNTAIQLNFTPPSSTNAISYYECYADGVLKNKITASGQYIIGLTASTSYNFTVIAVDIFYNKSLVSNSVTQSTNTTSAVPITGLVSYYKLESNSNDSQGSNNGTDTSVTYASGKVSNAAVYNGTTSKTIIGNPANLQLNTGSISCWIKTSSAGSSYRSIFGKTDAYNMFLVDGVLIVYNWGSYGGSGAKSTGVNLNDGLWHHLVFVFESGTANNFIYLDGVLILTFSMSVSNQSNNVCIGSSNSSQYLNGLIDEANVYNVKLTQNQIDILYNLGTGTTL